jgi:two-component system cell cycle sensor histidine kinase/response regulator CckA
VREVVTGQLESLGYRVLACASGEQALAVAAGHAGRLHLLLSDVVLPGIGGRELRARILAGRPGLKVLFMSGYGEDVIARHRVPPAEFRLIEKPFSRPALARAVRGALDS